MTKSNRRWLFLLVAYSCLAMYGCSDGGAPSNKSKEHETPTQNKVTAILLDLESSRDDQKRIGTAQSLFSLLKKNQDISVLNYRNAKEILHYMKDANDAVRYWIALSLSFFGAYADEIVPELLSSLDDRAADYSSLSSSDAILLTLKKIEPSWRKRADVTKRVLERWPKD